ncbi:hypothetical protein KC19_5G077200 [Ceratodon purpureus]|uniref:Uncharacterized protein n=1 Tax=Ceratodon purpureus TaxID=3225 RepID=A0A8T0I1D2_CERPU|nr:hypothetical protein KC19_5G077200 [Ceratodon purpureus]
MQWLSSPQRSVSRQLRWTVSALSPSRGTAMCRRRGTSAPVTLLPSYPTCTEEENGNNSESLYKSILSFSTEQMNDVGVYTYNCGLNGQSGSGAPIHARDDRELKNVDLRYVSAVVGPVIRTTSNRFELIAILIIATNLRPRP